MRHLCCLALWLYLGGLAQVGLCDTGKTVFGQIEVLKKGGKRLLKDFDNAIVYLTGVNAADPSTTVIVHQSDKRFSPRILPVVRGQTVQFHNRDKIDHNVFSPENEAAFDLGHYPNGQFETHKFDEVGIYKVYCNIHKAMILDVVVVPNPYFAVTDSDGNYQIKNVPDGDYQLLAWHIYGGKYATPITVNSNLAVPLISLTSTHVVREIEKHLDKEGEPYPSLIRYRK